MRTSGDLVSAFEKLSKKDANGVMAVTDFEIPPFWALKEHKGYLMPFFDQKYLIRSQDLPKVFVDNGSIYIIKIKVFKEEKSVYCSKLIPYHMPRERSIDIDEEYDLRLAELLLGRMEGST